MRRVLITGASGFIGRHLCNCLLRHGWQVRGTRRRLPAPAGFSQQIEWVETGEIDVGFDWHPALEGVTHVVHLMALAHQIGSDDGPDADCYHRVNVLATRELSLAARQADNVQRLIFVSSIGAVCSSSDHPVNEHTPCSPDTVYGKSKLAAEAEIRQVLESGRPDWCIVRPPLVYGSGNPGNMARLMKLVKLPLPLPLGSIRNRRSIIYVGNLVDFIRIALEHPGASREHFCVSDREDLSTNALISRLASQAGRRVHIVPLPLSLLKWLARAGDLTKSLSGVSFGLDSYSLQRLSSSLPVDCSKAREILGWKPPFSVDTGLQDAVRNPLEFGT